MINKVFVQINDCTNNFYIHSILNSISNAACMSHFFIFLYFSISILIFHYFLNLYNKYFFFIIIKYHINLIAFLYVTWLKILLRNLWIKFLIYKLIFDLKRLIFFLKRIQKIHWLIKKRIILLKKILK